MNDGRYYGVSRYIQFSKYFEKVPPHPSHEPPAKTFFFFFLQILLQNPKHQSPPPLIHAPQHNFILMLLQMK